MSAVEIPTPSHVLDDEEREPDDPSYVHGRLSREHGMTLCGRISDEPICCNWTDGHWMGRTDCPRCARPICPTCYRRL